MQAQTIWTAERINDEKGDRGIDKMYQCQLNGADALGFYKDAKFWVAKGSKLSPSFTKQTDDNWGDADYSEPLHWRTEMTEEGHFIDNTVMQDEYFGNAQEMAIIVSGVRLPIGDWWMEV